MNTKYLLRQTLRGAAANNEMAPPSLDEFTSRRDAARRRPLLRIAVLATAGLLLTAGAAGAASQLWDFDLRVLMDTNDDHLGLVEGSDLFTPGAPFHCTGFFDMTPSEAEELVRGRGFEVSWQYDVANWPIGKTPPETAYLDEIVLLDERTARILATPNRRPVRPDGGCP